MLRHDQNGLVTYRFESLVVEGLDHAIFTRLGGISQEPFASLNTGGTVGDDPAAVAENHARIYSWMKLDSGQVASTHQIHGNHVAVVDASHGGRRLPSADGLVTEALDLGLLLRFADCQPVILYDPRHHTLGLVHAGWRGVAQGIALRAVEAMQQAFGTHPEDLVTGLGPAIEPCCYTVGDDVAAAMGYSLPDWKKTMVAVDEGWRLDLSAANAQLLRAAGVKKIEHARLCTSCHHDEFYSHRAEKGKTGRFAVVACLRARESEPVREPMHTAQAEPEPEDTPEYDSLNPLGFPGFERG